LLQQNLPAAFQSAPVLRHVAELQRVLYQGQQLQEQRAHENRASAAAAAAVGHPTVQLLRARLRQDSLPGARIDNFKLGLVVEGGGMGGVVSRKYSGTHP